MLPEPFAGDAAGVGVVVAAVVVVEAPSLACWVRWTTTRGAFTRWDGAGVIAGVVWLPDGVVVVVVCVGVLWVLGGALATGVKAVVVSVGAGVVVVGVVLVVDWVGASGAGVVDVSVEGAVPTEGSAASAPPDSGPPRPATVKPPPASAERIARRIHMGTFFGSHPEGHGPAAAAARASFTPDIGGPCSLSSRPMVAFGAGHPRPRAPP